MKSKNLLILFLILIITTLSGCSSKQDSSAPGYSIITAKEAKEMMDQDSTITILDVRTEEEYNTGHIEGAIFIPDTEILEKAEETLTDKSATILVYCRSGRRSALAAADLVELGYTNVYDFGGIIDWKYNVVTDPNLFAFYNLNKKFAQKRAGYIFRTLLSKISSSNVLTI